ncbi:Aste57867_14666 [Aphanomyces stellatus]|uniref:Aste57867_14666 protein n=1 Tax=Aphanomyces stellatus TaxID=120398 RepID=A0A485L2Z5_9STRA|nr:hypothetical protein As57867_014611 [Aphanomyces stellatus]VFT91484.1 Aste57867_14666 [Aphanomyces stellatus]
MVSKVTTLTPVHAAVAAVCQTPDKATLCLVHVTYAGQSWYSGHHVTELQALCSELATTSCHVRSCDTCGHLRDLFPDGLMKKKPSLFWPHSDLRVAMHQVGQLQIFLRSVLMATQGLLVDPHESPSETCVVTTLMRSFLHVPPTKPLETSLTIAFLRVQHPILPLIETLPLYLTTVGTKERRSEYRLASPVQFLLPRSTTSSCVC